MTNIITVQKTKKTHAIQLGSSENYETARQWMTQSGVDAEHTDEILEELSQKKFWLLRDIGSQVIYLSHPADFLQEFEEVEDEPGVFPEITTTPADTDPFTLEVPNTIEGLDNEE